jgi:hypothetical protein
MEAMTAHANTPHRVHTGQATSRTYRMREQHAQRSEKTGMWANCQSEMAHGKEQRHHARAPTPEFSIYATLLQETIDHGFQQLFAAKCNTTSYMP